MKHDQDLPDPSTWHPRMDAQEKLGDALKRRGKATEQLILLRSKFEKEMSIDSFDSGPGVEDIIRDEIRTLLPSRYSVRAGVIDDRDGATAGDFDVVIFNDAWFPTVKAGATEVSRRYHYPIEGVYAVIEVKQTIDFATLDHAMQKLVTCQRLRRPATFRGRVTENRTEQTCMHGQTNPLYSAIVAVSLRDGLDAGDLVQRFFDISQLLKRRELVRALCVLERVAVTWGCRDDAGEIKPADFSRDLDKAIFPVMHTPEPSGSVFFRFVCDLSNHLYHSVLAPEDIMAAYGGVAWGAATPKEGTSELSPDRDPWEFERVTAAT